LSVDGLSVCSFKCPTNWFDVLPPDTEPEDDPEMKGVVPLITQSEEYDDDIHLPEFSTRAIGYGFGEGDARDEEDRTLRHFVNDVLGNSSTPVSDDDMVAVASDSPPVSDDSDVPQGQDTLVMTSDMTGVQD
jgi:hypothetical protein